MCESDAKVRNQREKKPQPEMKLFLCVICRRFAFVGEQSKQNIPEQNDA